MKEIEEIQKRINELEEIVSSKDSKSKKWSKVKEIIKWIADKGVDVGIALLPLVLKDFLTEVQDEQNSDKEFFCGMGERKNLYPILHIRQVMLGISENGIAESCHSQQTICSFLILAQKDYAEVSDKEISQRDVLVKAINQKKKMP